MGRNSSLKEELIQMQGLELKLERKLELELRLGLDEALGLPSMQRGRVLTLKPRRWKASGWE